jgi:hypothetical protein
VEAKMLDASSRSTPIFKTDLVWLGIPLPALVSLVNWYALEQCAEAEWRGWPLYATYTLFVLEVAGLSGLVGARVTKHPWWWLIFFWAITLVDLQLITIVTMNRTTRWGTSWPQALGYGMLSAQIGFVVICGILCNIAWRIRLPLAGFGLAMLISIGSILGNGQWASVIFFQTVATFTVAVVLRWFRFRIARPQEPSDGDHDGSHLQFSIRHLFYWTTAAAIIVGIGRLIGWRMMVYAAGFTSITVLTPTFTTISMLAVWAALGRERWFVRLPVILVALPVTGVLLNLFEQPRARGGANLIYPYDLTWGPGYWRVFGFWMVWACLAGFFLAGLVIVFRAAGNRLQRFS